MAFSNQSQMVVSTDRSMFHTFMNTLSKQQHEWRLKTPQTISVHSATTDVHIGTRPQSMQQNSSSLF